MTFDDGTTYAAGEVTLGTPFAHGTGLFPEFTLRAGGTAAVATDVLTIRHRPLPPDLAGKGGLLYIAAAPSEGDVRTAYRVVSNDHDSVTVSPSVDLSSDITVPTQPRELATTAGPFTLVAAETVIFDLGDGSGNRTLTSTLGAGNFTAAQLVTEFNGLADAEFGPGIRQVEFEVGGTNNDQLQIRLLADAGAAASFVLRGAGTLNAIVGWTNPGDTTVSNGVDGQIVRLQWQQELGGGYDGIAGIADSDYEVALDTDPTAAALSPLLPRNTGVLKIGVPGVQSAAVQTAAMAWAHAHNGIAVVEIPDTVVTESAAIAYHEANLAVGAAQDYHRAPWPSYGKITNPYGSGLYTTSMVGAILGFEARKATDDLGFHLAPAGVTASLSPLFKDLTTGDKVLNKRGTQRLRAHRGPQDRCEHHPVRGPHPGRDGPALLPQAGDQLPHRPGAADEHPRAGLQARQRLHLRRVQAARARPVPALVPRRLVQRRRRPRLRRSGRDQGRRHQQPAGLEAGRQPQHRHRVPWSSTPPSAWSSPSGPGACPRKADRRPPPLAGGPPWQPREARIPTPPSPTSTGSRSQACPTRSSRASGSSSG